jgi:hypothetical protein
MNAFETAAIIEDARHLALREPVPATAARECRVIVLFDAEAGGKAKWPDGFSEQIWIDDPNFGRPTLDVR